MKIYPSLMASDLRDIKATLQEVKVSDGVHFDVMDGHFVANLTFGPDILKAVKRSTRLPVMVHLMVERPDIILKQMIPFLDPKDSVLVHAENKPRHRDAAISMLKRAGIPAGLAINPETGAKKAVDLIIHHKLDSILIMGIHPGFYGLSMLSGTTQKVKDVSDRLAKLARKNPKAKMDIIVDGGVTLSNAASLKRAGATGMCSGKEIFRAKNPMKAAREFQAL